MKDVYTQFGLEPGTKDFIGHAMALYLTDEYVQLMAGRHNHPLTLL